MPWLRYVLRVILASYLLPAILGAGGVTAAPFPPQSVVFWYSGDIPLPEIAQSDWAVLEPAHASASGITFLTKQGTAPFAYLSVGEVYKDALSTAQAGSILTGQRNAGWDSEVADLTSADWQQHLFDQAKAFRQQGYAGLFLDTLDSFTLLPAEQHKAQQQALIALLERLHAELPQLQLFMNRGFEVLPELSFQPAGVAVESLEAGWNQTNTRYQAVSPEDRSWLDTKLKPLRAAGIPVVAIEYLPAERRQQARELSRKLVAEGYIPFITTPDLASIGTGSLEVVPRRIALLFDPREGGMSASSGHRLLGGLLEYLGYRVDYFPVDSNLPEYPFSELYAGVVVWMTSGVPAAKEEFKRFVRARLDEAVPLAFMGGLPIEDSGLLARMGIRRSEAKPGSQVQLLSHDKQLIGEFEAPLQARVANPQRVHAVDEQLKPVLSLRDSAGEVQIPVATADWGGYALEPYLLQEGASVTRWILDPFAFLQRSLKLPVQPILDATTENGRRIATVHIDGDGFASRAEISGTPYSGEVVLRDFIQANAYLTSVSVIEGEVGPKGMYPELSGQLEPIARRIFADPKVEPATHTFSHPFYWEPEKAEQREGFTAEYGLNMQIPNYPVMDVEREIIGSQRYIENNLLPAGKKIRLIFWSGEALAGADAVAMAYAAGMDNVNGAQTYITRANPSLTGLSPLLRPTVGGLQIYAPVINENLYTNLWTGPFYGFERVIDTFALTDSPRRLRGINLYYHFYSGTKQASIKAMADIYAYMDDQKAISLWMGDYLRRIRGLYEGSLSQRIDGRWQLRSLQGLRTVRLDPQLGWPDLLQSEGVAGVRDLPQGRYVHLTADSAVLALRPERDPAPALEEANIPLLKWQYLDKQRVELSFAGQYPLQLTVRYAGSCQLQIGERVLTGQQADGLLQFSVAQREVTNALLTCR